MKNLKTTLTLLFCFSVFLLSTLSSQAADATFSWIPNDPDPAGYRIYYGIESRNYTQVIDVASPVQTGGRIIETVTGLEEGQTYYFAATAYSETEESGYTDEIVHTIPLTTIPSSSGEATFSWMPNDPEPDGYKIYYGTESRNYTEVVDVVSPELIGGLVVETVTGLLQGETYYFAATAYSGAEESAYTEEVVYTVTGSPVSNPPVVGNVSMQGVEDTVLFGQLLVDDSSNVDEYNISSGPSNGTLSVEDSTGSFSYTPGPHFSGVDTFIYSASNAVGTSGTATATLNIAPVNDLPVADNASISTAEDTLYSGQLTASDVDDSNLTYSLVSPSAKGVVNLGSNGSFTYTPHQDVSGSDTFSFRVNDGSSDSNIAVVNISINPVNDVPVANGTSIVLGEDTLYSGQLTASDIESNTLVYSLVTQPAKGTVSLTSAGSFTYTPHGDVSGFDSFTFRVNDGSSNSNIATVNITIDSVNDSPVASSTNILVDEDSSYSGQLSASDIDGNTLVYFIVSQAGKGDVSITSTGSFTYLPNQDISGSDSFTFKANDGSSDSNIATVNVTIQNVNDAPVAEDSNFDIDAGGSYSGQLVATDDGNMLTYSVVAASEIGSVSIAGDGSFTYVANDADSGSDSFTFNVADGSLVSNTATVTITINEVQNELAFEVGELLVTSVWQRVDFSTTFIDPSVIAKSASTNDPETAVVSIRNVSNTGFDIRIQEWDYLDDIHPEEVVSFLAMERGHHQITDEVYAVADCATLSGLNSYTSIAFTNPLATQPVVLSSVVSTNESDAVTLRLKDLGNSGFAIAMQEQENNDGVHVDETMCYIAWENMSGMVDSLMIEVVSTDNALTQASATVSFDQQFTEIPFLMAGMQTTNGANTAILGLSDVSITDMGMTILEEQSADSEINHIAEVGGYFAISPFNPDEDSDNDGLTNAEEIEIHTHPGLWDTDGDTMSDSDEYDHWINLGYSYNSDIDGDGLDNLHDADSDNDGALDGIEIAKGYDPADANSYPSLGFELETGEVLVGNEPVRVHFSKNYLQPVVIANIVSKNDSEPCVVRISDVTGDGFNVQLQEYGYQDNIHDIEMVSYIVMEEGSHTLDDGTKIEAGLFTTDNTGSFESISFLGVFDIEPVVLTSVSSMNDTETVTGRVKNISVGGFQFKLQEQEANAKEHGLELVAYIAWTPGAGVTNGIRFEAGKTPDSVTHNSYSVAIDQSFAEMPYHFADMQTTDGGDTSTLRITQSGLTDLDVIVEEECSKESEIKHTKEVAGYLVILQES